MITIRDIAALASVSIGTVSHVLNHPDRVAPATRDRVHHAILQLEWQPNVAAQTLRRCFVPFDGQGDHHTVGHEEAPPAPLA